MENRSLDVVLGPEWREGHLVSHRDSKKRGPKHSPFGRVLCKWKTFLPPPACLLSVPDWRLLSISFWWWLLFVIAARHQLTQNIQKEREHDEHLRPNCIKYIYYYAKTAKNLSDIYKCLSLFIKDLEMDQSEWASAANQHRIQNLCRRRGWIVVRRNGRKSRLSVAVALFTPFQSLVTYSPLSVEAQRSFVRPAAAVRPILAMAAAHSEVHILLQEVAWKSPWRPEDSRNLL